MINVLLKFQTSVKMYVGIAGYLLQLIVCLTLLLMLYTNFSLSICLQ